MRYGGAEDASTGDGLLQLKQDTVYELDRLIGNSFQLRTNIGDPVQLSLLILLMSGEQHEMTTHRTHGGL